MTPLATLSATQLREAIARLERLTAACCPTDSLVAAKLHSGYVIQLLRVRQELARRAASTSWRGRVLGTEATKK